MRTPDDGYLVVETCAECVKCFVNYRSFRLVTKVISKFGTVYIEICCRPKFTGIIVVNKLFDYYFRNCKLNPRSLLCFTAENLVFEKYYLVFT